ncbi:XVIPCD domain-containing protein [Luteimonas sp. MC1750]|uniref:XVIPCD domain-containing protein n=1 Tax=Luteimonas sp. MC1750 TaxID=2799326 RepID=UPI0018F0B4A1|nr:XVIPCD domain-containing protein [Luteimonas sp. MC1750]MBJ6985044.1 peptidoglycan-binding protein [Luteimonas sp. MC1750]QQO05710.1 peptidoglycan-binding protein [Luteimonas sp. MC1750]
MSGHGRSTGGFGIERAASVRLIVRTALEYGVDDPKQIAYILATAQHETRNFTAPDEDFGRSQARKLGYSGGEDYYGRGYVHLTHDYNYKKFDELLGLGGTLMSNPDGAKDPELAAKILVIGMRDGLFTGRRLDRYINNETEDSYNARRVVNGITRQEWTIKAAEDCKRYATAWEAHVPALIAAVKAEILEEQTGWPHDLRRALERLTLPQPSEPPLIRDGLPDFLRVTPAPQPTRPASRDLQLGMHGSHVRELQEALDGLGIRDGRGRALAADGIFGTSTHQAVENFQLWNGLDASGVVDGSTRRLLLDPAARMAAARARPGDAATPAHGPTLADPGEPTHPDHAMYRCIRAGVREIGAARGEPYDVDTCERISRCLLARCRGAEGPQGDPTHGSVHALRSVDHVVLGTTGQLFAIEGRLDDPAQRRVQVSVVHAALVPVEESDRRLAGVAAQSARRPDPAQILHPAQGAPGTPGAPIALGAPAAPWHG